MSGRLRCGGAGSAQCGKSLAGVELRAPGDGGSMGPRGDRPWRDEDRSPVSGRPMAARQGPPTTASSPPTSSIRPMARDPSTETEHMSEPGRLQRSRGGHGDSCIPQTQDTHGLVGLGEQHQADCPDRWGIVTLAVPRPAPPTKRPGCTGPMPRDHHSLAREGPDLLILTQAPRSMFWKHQYLLNEYFINE